MAKNKATPDNVQPITAGATMQQEAVKAMQALSRIYANKNKAIQTDEIRQQLAQDEVFLNQFLTSHSDQAINALYFTYVAAPQIAAQLAAVFADHPPFYIPLVNELNKIAQARSAAAVKAQEGIKFDGDNE